MAIDVLSYVLRVVRLSGAVFFTAEFSSPWALESPPADALASIVMPDAECVVLFHMLIDGECVVECQSHPAVKMEAGDVIVFPHGHPHTMGSRDAIQATPIGAVFIPGSRDELPQICFGGGGRASRFVCGYLNCDQRFGPLMGALPTMLLVGEAPMRYLANWRMQLAKQQLLREGTHNIQEVAARVGYESEAALNRGATGLPPATWRRGTSSLSA